WIKNSDGKYILVNNKLSKSFGLKNTQVEGKLEKAFILPHLVEFRIAIEEYLKNSINCVLLEGIPFKGIPSIDNYQLVEIPIVDSENKVIAVIGIAQKKSNKKLEVLPNGNDIYSSNIIYNLPKAVAIFDKDGFIQTRSEKFYNFIDAEISLTAGLKYTEILNEDLSNKLKLFYESKSIEQAFDFKLQPKLNAHSSFEDVKIYLNKIVGNENQIEGVIMLIDNASQYEDFEKLLSGKGKMFDLLIKDNPEPIYIYDKDNLMFLEVNNGALQLYGYSKEEFLKMDLTDLYTPEDIQTLLDTHNKEKEGRFGGPFKHRKKDGSFVYVEISRLSFKYGEKDAHFNIIKDVTEKLELEKKNQLFKLSFENADDLHFITDDAGFIQEINKKVFQVIGSSFEELINSSFTALINDEDRGKINSNIFQSNVKEAQLIETKLKKSNGELINAEIAAVPILNFKGEIDSFSIIIKIKEEKISEVSEKNKLEKFENSETKSPTISQSSISLSNIFHEILTPINAIIGFAQEITESIFNPTDEQKESIEYIKQNKDILMKSVNSIVEYSKIEEKSEKLKIEKIKIPDVVEEINNNFNFIVGTDQIEFGYGRISSSLTFSSDKENFMKLLKNLIQIASTFIKNKKIYLSAYQYDENNFVITLKDNYTNASQFLVESFNKLFINSDHYAKQAGISKISVNLSKSLLKLLKGEYLPAEDKQDISFIFPKNISDEATNENFANDKVEEDLSKKNKIGHNLNQSTDYLQQADSQKVYQSPIEKDETDTVQLQFEKEKSEKQFQISDTEVNLDLSHLTCLYIEDQIDSQILFSLQMKELKDIKYAVSFEEALPLLENNTFDFILIDINILGEYNGLDVLKIIHKMPAYHSLPIIAVSSYVLPGDKEKFIAAGFNDFISKPIFREKVISSLEKIFLMQM
ncbi:MAG: PAS domain S-box protein, partial [Ignavibacteriaceae bacterium]